MTIRRALLGALLVPLGFGGVVGASYGLGVQNREPAHVAPRDDGPSRAERLIERHDCWSGSAPVGADPTHAVVTLPHEGAKLAPADVGFGLWLGPDGVADTGDELAGTLHAFCEKRD